MNNEIEIKFLAISTSQQVLVQLLSQYPILQQEIKHLTSVYFDTPERHLEKWGMGLRVRHGEGENVQTLKTGGRVVGGLHQRPEYNVAIDDKRPRLSLFSSLDWPDSADIDAIEAQLSPIFSTEFERQTWLLDLSHDTLVEVAFDQGEVVANQAKEGICEIELELVKGDLSQLLHLAMQLAQQGGLRLANISKAKRGYALAVGLEQQVQDLSLVDLSGPSTTAEALTKILGHALDHWQYHEQLFVTQLDQASLGQVYQSVQMLYQACKMFVKLGLVECDWLAELRWFRKQFYWIARSHNLADITADRGAMIKKLPQQRSLLKTLNKEAESLPQAEDMSQLMHSARYCQLMLKITRWLYAENWQKNTQLEQQSIKRFATELLEASWQDLKKTALADKNLSAATYIKQAAKLRRNLLVGVCVGQLYNEALREEFRLPWMDTLSGIEELRLYQPLHDLLPSLDEEQQQSLAKWLQRKEQSLLEAIDFSRHQAWKQVGYWRFD